MEQYAAGICGESDGSALRVAFSSQTGIRACAKLRAVLSLQFHLLACERCPKSNWGALPEEC